MALSISQATQVNALLVWLLDIDTLGSRGDWDHARIAAMALAEAANKSIGAGVHSRMIESFWRKRNASGALRRKRGQLKSARAPKPKGE